MKISNLITCHPQCWHKLFKRLDMEVTYTSSSPLSSLALFSLTVLNAVHLVSRAMAAAWISLSLIRFACLSDQAKARTQRLQSIMVIRNERREHKYTSELSFPALFELDKRIRLSGDVLCSSFMVMVATLESLS